MKPILYSTLRHFCRRISIFLFAICGSLASASEKKQERPRVDTLISIACQLIAEIASFAKEGDSELKGILTRFDLSEDTDWELKRNEPEQVEQILQGISKALLTLAERNANAKAIVTKYQIKFTPP
jgi:hypothetical protein